MKRKAHLYNENNKFESSQRYSLNLFFIFAEWLGYTIFGGHHSSTKNQSQMPVEGADGSLGVPPKIKYIIIFYIRLL